MRFRLYREYGALNSTPVFDAFEKGIRSHGHEIVSSGEDISVIWSVLWSGRMASNKRVYEDCLKNHRPVVIIEVGTLIRGKTWKIGLNHINNLGIFANDADIDHERPKKLGLTLQPPNNKRSGEILIAGQHDKSLQWEGQKSLSQWALDQIHKIRTYTKRPIVIRPHPRCQFSINFPGVKIELPKKISGTYDDFDIDYNFHCVVNHNSGPCIQAAIQGTPIICDSSSLAAEISDFYENIENPHLPDRHEWFTKLCHTEWTVPEIERGFPISRLIQKIPKNTG